MWEQRYGFPEPGRTASGYRVYTEHDVVAIRRVVAYRDRGLSVPAALERARDAGGRDRQPLDLRRARLGRRAGAPAAAAPGDADRALARDRGGGDGARRRAGRDRRLPGRGATTAPSSTATGGSRTWPTPSACSRPSTSRGSATRTSRPRSRSRTADALGHEWAVVVDAPGYAACLVGWETPGAPASGSSRRSGRWTRRSCAAPRRSARRSRRAHAPEWSERLLAILADRPLAVEAPAPGLTALTNRMIGYLDAAVRSAAPGH